MQNTLNTLQRDTNITWFTQTMGYIHTEIANPIITVQKDEGIQPTAIPLHFLFMLSQSLTESQRLFTMLQYNKKPYTDVLQLFSFIGEIPWENTTINPIPWVHKTIGQHTSQKKFSGAPPLNPKAGGMSV